MGTDRLLKDCGGDAVRRGLYDAQTVRTADAPAKHVAALGAQVVQQCEVVGGVGVPAVLA